MNATILPKHGYALQSERSDLQRPTPPKKALVSRGGDTRKVGHRRGTGRGDLSLIDLLHLGALIAVLLEGQAELDHAVDAAREGGRLVEREARGEQARLEEQVHQVLDGLVALVGGGLGLE